MKYLVTFDAQIKGRTYRRGAIVELTHEEYLRRKNSLKLLEEKKPDTAPVAEGPAPDAIDVNTATTEELAASGTPTKARRSHFDPPHPGMLSRDQLKAKLRELNIDVRPRCSYDEMHRIFLQATEAITTLPMPDTEDA